jgi:hypothetical protein
MHTPFEPQQFPEPPAAGGHVRPAPGASAAGQPTGLMRAMSPGVVDFLFRQLVAGRSAEDIQWQQEGIALTAQPPGAELARRLAEADVDALTPTELFHYVRSAQRLAAWAEGLREAAVQRYCHPGEVEDAGVQDAGEQDAGVQDAKLPGARLQGGCLG